MKLFIASVAAFAIASPSLAQNAPPASTDTTTNQSTTTTAAKTTTKHKVVRHHKPVTHRKHHVVRHTHVTKVKAHVQTSTTTKS